MVRSRHGLEPSAAVSHGGDGAGVDRAILGRAASHRPVKRGLHVRDHRLRGPRPTACDTVSCNDIPVAGNLDQEVLVRRRVRCTTAVAPSQNGHGDVGRGWGLGGEDGVFGKLGIGECLGGIGTGAGCRLTSPRRLATGSTGIVPYASEICSQIRE